MTHQKLTCLASLFLVAIGAYSAFAHANSPYPDVTSVGLPPPEVSVIDGAGTDLMSGVPDFSLSTLSIGSGVSQLNHSIAPWTKSYFYGFRDDYTFQVVPIVPGNRFSVQTGHSSQQFSSRASGNSYSPVNRDGSILIGECTGGDCGTFPDTYTYTRSDGTKVYFTPNQRRVVYPNGFEVTIHGNTLRRSSITTNTGLQLKYNYSKNRLESGQDPFRYHYPTSIVAINNAVEHCNPLADTCALSESWPTVNYHWPSDSVRASNVGNFRVVDAHGSETIYRHQAKSINSTGGHTESVISSVRAATGKTSSAVTSSYEYEHVWWYKYGAHSSPVIAVQNALHKVHVGGETWEYVYQKPNTPWVSEKRSNGPTGSHRLVLRNNGSPFFTIGSVATSEGIQASFSDGYHNNPESVTERGRKYEFEYDSRGNVIRRSQINQGSVSGYSAEVVMQAEYESECNENNIKWCNRPKSVTDGRGNRTDYTYHEPSGQIETITQPADAQGRRPQTRHFYEQLYAHYKDASGQIRQADTPIWMLVKTSMCKSTSASGNGCANATDEIVTHYSYGPDTGPNNLWLRRITVEADGQSRTTCYDYDKLGNVIHETLPRAGLTACY